MTVNQMIKFLDLRYQSDALGAELGAVVEEFFASGWYILGDGLKAFEARFAEYVGVQHCIGVGSGLEALHLLLRAHDVGPGDEVIVPSNTYIATWLAVTHAGATPVPVEPDPATYNLDPGRVEAAIGPRTKALLPVHLYGQPADMGFLRAIADSHGLRLLEDAAQAHGALHHGRQVGSLGDGAGFSFYPSKNLGAFGDGGAVTTDDDDLADRLRLLRNYGSPRKYEHEIVGYNSRLDELQARLLTLKLRFLDEWNSQRRTQAALYLDELQDADVVLPTVPDGAEPVWHVFVIRTSSRDDLADHLERHGVQTLIHYPVPPHLQPAYATLGLGVGTLPIAEDIHATVLSLPIGPHLSENQIKQVAAAVRAFSQG